MKKAILVLITSAFVLSSCGQSADFDSFKGIESDKVLNLSADQIAKIKKLNQEVGPKFRAIGQSDLPGYEKGQKKRALALEHKAAIREILSKKQIEIWESNYGSMDKDNGLRDIIKDDYDIRLKQLEQTYDKNKRIIEKSSLSKDARKTKLKVLKDNYKSEKNRLKDQRDSAVRSGVLGQ